jgi:hypothetical protein
LVPDTPEYLVFLETLENLEALENPGILEALEHLDHPVAQHRPENLDDLGILVFLGTLAVL